MPDTLRPLLPPVRLQIGVTGHRLGPKLPPQSVAPIRATVDRILVETAKAARVTVANGHGGLIAESLELIVVSALAEGADRIVAEAGLAAGFSLETVLPFAREEYSRDFETAGSRDAFNALIAAAASVFELDGKRAQANRAYEAAGLITLANCDVLIAIWDRNEAAGVGGTALIVDRAINEGIPVVLVNPAEPERASLLWASDEDLTPASLRHEVLSPRDALAEIPTMVDFLIVPPPGRSRSNLATYLREKERRRNFVPWYAFLLFFFSGRKVKRSDFQMPPYLDHSQEEWKDYFKIVHVDDRLAKAINEILLPAFSFADNLSVFYARIYRGTYIFNYLAAAIVATLAVLGIILNEWRQYATIVGVLEFVELTLVGAGILSWWIPHKFQAHRRYLEYRRLAESLRHMRLIALTASAGSIPRPGRSLEAESDWVDWYARAIRRILPLPKQKVDDGYLTMINRAACDAELTGQIRYHQGNAELMRKLDHRLHRLGQYLFGSTALLLVLLLFMPLLVPFMPAWMDVEVLRTAMTYLTVAFPIFGSAFNAIQAQADFISISRRSRQTADRLISVRNALGDGSPSFALLADRVEMASDMMMDDLVEWQLVFRTRPLSLPV